MRIIGKTTTYQGKEHRSITGRTVRIIAVLKGAATQNHNPDADDADDAYLSSDEAIVAAGGVSADDRVEVLVWGEAQQRFSFVSMDPLATDLACFAHLAR